MAPSDAVPAGPRSRSFVWPILRWLAASVVVAALGAMLVLPRVIGTPQRVTRLAATALPDLLADVKPARVQLGWFGPIVLEDVQIVPRNGDKTPLAIRRIEVSHGLGPAAGRVSVLRQASWGTGLLSGLNVLGR